MTVSSTQIRTLLTLFEGWSYRAASNMKAFMTCLFFPDQKMALTNVAQVSCTQAIFNLLKGEDGRVDQSKNDPPPPLKTLASG